MEESVHKHVNERPDITTIGTPSKGGENKVYFNANMPLTDIEALIFKAFQARDYAQKQLAQGNS
jgi:hypothetical protein